MIKTSAKREKPEGRSLRSLDPANGLRHVVGGSTERTQTDPNGQAPQEPPRTP